MMHCLFCKISTGDTPADVVFENDRVIAFRDINPQAPIHILIIPKTHIPTLNDLEEIILKRPVTGYINLSHFHELTNVDEGKIVAENIIFKPEYIRIGYTLTLEGYEFNMYSIINLKERKNNLVSRSFTK